MTDLELLLKCVECDAFSFTAGTSCSSRSVNICLRFLGRLNLNDQVDAGNVKTTRSDISGDQYAKLLLLEALQSDFSLVLSDVSVHDLDVFLDFL